MDDGQQVKKGGVTLCTDSFNSQEISILRNALTSNFKLFTSIHNKKKSEDMENSYERIYLRKAELEDIKPNLKEHMLPSMLYKINMEEALVKDESNIIENEEKKIIKQDSSSIEGDMDLIDIFGDL